MKNRADAYGKSNQKPGRLARKYITSNKVSEPQEVKARKPVPPERGRAFARQVNNVPGQTAARPGRGGKVLLKPIDDASSRVLCRVATLCDRKCG